MYEPIMWSVIVCAAHWSVHKAVLTLSAWAYVLTIMLNHKTTKPPLLLDKFTPMCIQSRKGEDSAVEHTKGLSLFVCVHLTPGVVSGIKANGSQLCRESEISIYPIVALFSYKKDANSLSFHS